MRLFDLLPRYYKPGGEMELWQNALDAQMKGVYKNWDNTLDQFFVDTATDGLDKWEKRYGLKPDVSKSLEYRRTRLISKMRGVGTTTAAHLKNVAESFSNGQVEIIEYPGEYRFTVDFVGTLGKPPNMDDLTAAIDEIIPAHLSYDYHFRYRTWGELNGRTWGQLSQVTWDDARGGILNGMDAGL